jgi:23S rRNA (guanosine2251-2'-O)-methyltransferase
MKTTPPVPQDIPAEDASSLFVYGRRAVAEALRAGRDIEKIFIEYGVQPHGIRDILAGAKERGIPVMTSDKKKFAVLEKTAGAGNYAQGVIALVVAYTAVDEEVLFQQALAHSKVPVLVALDGINDPHNLGAIARSVVCAGGYGLILPSHHSSPITSVAIKTGAGAFEYLAVSKVTNLHRTLERAKEAGYWIIGTDADSTHAYTAPLYDRPIVLLIGGEGSGMRSSTRKACDAIVSIPLHGALSSLNASVAAGVVLFEIARQRSLAP